MPLSATFFQTTKFVSVKSHSGIIFETHWASYLCIISIINMKYLAACEYAPLYLSTPLGACSTIRKMPLNEQKRVHTHKTHIFSTAAGLLVKHFCCTLGDMNKKNKGSLNL